MKDKIENKMSLTSDDVDQQFENQQLDKDEHAPTSPELRLIVTLSEGQSQEIAWGYQPGQDAEALWQASRLLGVTEGIAPALKYLREMCPELAKNPGCYVCYELAETREDAETRTLGKLADILAAAAYRRMTELRRQGAQAEVAQEAQKRAVELLEACRQSGYTLTLTPDRKEHE